MTRVIAGAAGGRRLAVPKGTTTRPTSDRAREGLFSSVAAELGGPDGLDGKRVLDLYAGSGAVGLEALSRGASQVLLVESDPRAAAVIKANIAAVNLPGAAVVTDRVERLLARNRDANDGKNDGNGRKNDNDGYDLAFADPPYAVTDEAVTRVLTQLAQGWLAAGALVVIERATRSGALDWPPGYLHGKSRRYGEATFWYGWFDNDAAAAQAEQAGQPRVTVSRSGHDAPGGAHEE
jgi:16S rRNA (guanine966-N2)-methyltransferase